MGERDGEGVNEQGVCATCDPFDALPIAPQSCGEPPSLGDDLAPLAAGDGGPAGEPQNLLAREECPPSGVNLPCWANRPSGVSGGGNNGGGSLRCFGGVPQRRILRSIVFTLESRGGAPCSRAGLEASSEI